MVVVAPSGTNSLGIRFKYGYALVMSGKATALQGMGDVEEEGPSRIQGCSSLGRSLTYEMSKGEQTCRRAFLQTADADSQSSISTLEAP